MKYISPASPSDLKLDEFRATSEKEWDRKETLDSRAISIVQVAGTITALIFGFVTIIQTSDKFSFTSYIENMIIASIVVIITSIVFSILVIWPRKYYFRIAIEDYFYKNANGESIFDITTLESKDNVEGVVASYARIIRKNNNTNAKKAILLIIAAILLVAGLALSSIVVIELFRLQPSVQSSIKGEFTCKELAVDNTKVIANNKILDSERSVDSGVLLCIK